MDCTKTLRLRIKDKHARVLSAMAREVNQVWNFCNETSHRAIRERRQWLSGYDLQKLTNGFSKCEGIHIGSPTVQQVCEDYAKARKQFKKAKLRWRVSNPQSSKYSLGWIPFKARALQYKAGQIVFAGHKFSLWDSYGLAGYELRAGSFSEDSRGRWYLNVVVKVQAKASDGKASVGIDLGLKEAAVASDAQRIQGRFYRKLEARLGIAQRAARNAGSRPSTPRSRISARTCCTSSVPPWSRTMERSLSARWPAGSWAKPRWQRGRVIGAGVCSRVCGNTRASRPVASLK